MGGDVAGVGGICLVFADGASMVLHDVRHMQMTQCMIFVSQLQDKDYAFTHTDSSWKIHRGLLVVARGARSGIEFPLYCSYIHVGAVHVVALPCKELERRTVSFQDALGVHVETGPKVQCLSSERHVESVDSSLDARQGQSSIEVTGLAIELETDALSCNAPDSSFEVDSDLPTAVHDMSAVVLAVAEVEQLCSNETQLDTSSDTMTQMACIGVDLSVMQPWMLMPELEACLSESVQTKVEQVYSLEPQAEVMGMDDMQVFTFETDLPTSFLDILQAEADAELFENALLSHHDIVLADLASVASAFGSLMYDILLSRPDIAYAVGAFAMGVVSRTVADSGIEQGRAMQVVTRFLQEVHVGSSTSGAHDAFLLEHIQTHAHIWSESVGVG